MKNSGQKWFQVIQPLGAVQTFDFRGQTHTCCMEYIYNIVFYGAKFVISSVNARSFNGTVSLYLYYGPSVRCNQRSSNDIQTFLMFYTWVSKCYSNMDIYFSSSMRSKTHEFEWICYHAQFEWIYWSQQVISWNEHSMPR